MKTQWNAVASRAKKNRFEVPDAALAAVADMRARLGVMLREWRVSRGLHQIDVGALLGVPAATMSYCENGDARVRVDYQIAMLLSLGVSRIQIATAVAGVG